MPAEPATSYLPAPPLAWLGVAMSGIIVVTLGAYAAHGLEQRVGEAMVAAVNTGVRYQMWHTLAIMVVLVWRQVQPRRGQGVAMICWALGMAGFSGSLYLMALSELTPGLLTPAGGLLLIIGWAALGLGMLGRAPPRRLDPTLEITPPSRPEARRKR